MSKNRYCPEDIFLKLRKAVIFISQGKTIVKTFPILGISDVTPTAGGRSPVE